MKWSVGVTTVPARREQLLPRTLASLRAAGFPSPRLFVDGERHPESWVDEFSLEVTARWPVIRTHGNWTLALLEMNVRDPTADRYMIVQDDAVMVRNLRPYLDACPMNGSAYRNLYTYPANQEVARVIAGIERGWFRTNQLGKGAVALVFDRASVVKLIASQHMAERPADPVKGSRSIDGGIVTALAKAGVAEECHVPSLVQHVGDVSTMGNRAHPQAPSFPGEMFDAMELLK